MSKKLIIFDLDGTLLDTSKDLMTSMNKMLESFGFPLITVEQAKQYIGNGAKNFVLRSLPENEKDKVEEALKVYNSIYNASGSPYTCLYEGIADLLACLKRENVLLAIVSNKPQPSTYEVYKKYLSGFGFDCVYGKRDGFKHKPQKECGEYVLNALNVKPEDVVVVGDGETDVEFAKNLGVSMIAVTWGYRTKEVLASYGANSFVQNSLELKEKLFQFIK